MLRDVSNINMKTTIMGDEIGFPIGVAPTALQRMAHDDGELATARGSYISPIFKEWCLWLSMSYKSKLDRHHSYM